MWWEYLEAYEVVVAEYGVLPHGGRHECIDEDLVLPLWVIAVSHSQVDVASAYHGASIGHGDNLVGEVVDGDAVLRQDAGVPD